MVRRKGSPLPSSDPEEQEEDEVEADSCEAHKVQAAEVHALSLFAGEGQGLKEGLGRDLQKLGEANEAARQAVLVRVHVQVGDTQVHQYDDYDEDQNRSEERQARLPFSVEGLRGPEVAAQRRGRDLWEEER